MRLCFIKNRQFILKNSFYDFCPNQSKGLQRISSRLFLSPVKDLGRYKSVHFNTPCASFQNESSCKTCQITVPFNKMRLLKFKAQPTKSFFPTVNQMFGSSSQLPTTAVHCFMLPDLNCAQRFDSRAEVGSSKEFRTLD